MPASETDQTDGEAPDGGDKPPLDSSRRHLAVNGTVTPVRTIKAALGARDATVPVTGKGGVHKDIIHDKQSSGLVNGHSTAMPTTTKPSSHLTLNGAHPPPGLSHASAHPTTLYAPQPRKPAVNGAHGQHGLQPPAPRSSSVSATSSQGYSSDSDSGAVSADSSRPPSRVSSFVADHPVKLLNGKDEHSAHVPTSARLSRPPSVKSLKSDDGGHKFNLKDLLGSGPNLRRKNSARSDSSSKRSDSDHSSADGLESTASLLKKYGVCGRAAIGKGATAVVRLAHKWDKTEEKLYAVKEFRKRRKNETEKEYVKKLTSEFCISSTLHHMNIVETVDLVQDENHNWCEVMEYCPGGDLYAVIKKGGMMPVEIECCFKQLLNGVAYLHSQGVAHRDIKPENLFFDGKGHLKIGDYGSSTVYRLPWEATVHKSTGLCGSEPYIAPEQFTNTPYDARLVDVWACGIVYYCMHFQEIPWRVAQASDPLYATYAGACAASPTNCPPTISSLQPRACRPLIRKMLEPDPKQRTLIDDVVNHPWIQGIEACVAGKPGKHAHIQCRIPT